MWQGFGHADSSHDGQPRPPPLMKVFGHGTTTGRGHAINTRESFVELASLGVDGVELDVRRTADDHLVVIHDERYSDGRLVVETDRRDRPPEVLLLDEALDLCRGLEVNIELKNFPAESTFDPDERIADLCAELLDERAGVDNVIVSCFGLACIDRVLARRPHTPTALLLLSKRPADQILAADVSERHRAVHPYISMVDERFVRRCAALDLRVNVWSAAEETDDMVQALIDHGVDGLITESAVRAMRLRDR